MTEMSTDVKQHYTLTLTFTEYLLGHRKDSKTASHSYFYKDDDGRPLLLDRHVMGFLKEAAQALNEVYGDGLESALTRKVFVAPKEVPLEMPDSASVEIIDRSPYLVRVDGRKVETVEPTSEAAPVGTRVTCELLVYPGVEEEVLIALLDYGRLKGMGLGRNQGFGRFEYELEVKDGREHSSADKTNS